MSLSSLYDDDSQSDPHVPAVSMRYNIKEAICYMLNHNRIISTCIYLIVLFVSDLSERVVPTECRTDVTGAPVTPAETGQSVTTSSVR